MEALGIDTKLLMAQLINFLLFTYIFVQFLYKPFKKYLAQQKQERKERDRLLADLQEKEANLKKKEEEVLTKARKKAAEIVQHAEDTASEKRKDIINQAQEEAVSIKQKALADIDDERSKMYDELREKIVRTSQTMTESVLKDFLSKDTQEDVLKQVFDKLKKSKTYEN